MFKNKGKILLRNRKNENENYNIRQKGMRKRFWKERIYI